MIRPEQYGACGDGIADDTAAVRQALDEARRLGDWLDLTGGTYKVVEQTPGEDPIHATGPAPVKIWGSPVARLRAVGGDLARPIDQTGVRWPLAFRVQEASVTIRGGLHVDADPGFYEAVRHEKTGASSALFDAENLTCTGARGSIKVQSAATSVRLTYPRWGSWLMGYLQVDDGVNAGGTLDVVGGESAVTAIPGQPAASEHAWYVSPGVKASVRSHRVIATPSYAWHSNGWNGGYAVATQGSLELTDFTTDAGVAYSIATHPIMTTLIRPRMTARQLVANLRGALLIDDGYLATTEQNAAAVMQAMESLPAATRVRVQRSTIRPRNMGFFRNRSTDLSTWEVADCDARVEQACDPGIGQYVYRANPGNLGATVLDRVEIVQPFGRWMEHHAGRLTMRNGCHVTSGHSGYAAPGAVVDIGDTTGTKVLVRNPAEGW